MNTIYAKMDNLREKIIDKIFTYDADFSNKISKVWNTENIGEDQINVVAWLTLENNAVIDYAKTLWLPTPPKEKEALIKKYTKGNLPYFFKYAKDKEDNQIAKINSSSMNRICENIYDKKINYCKTIGKMDYRAYGFR